MKLPVQPCGSLRQGDSPRVSVAMYMMGVGRLREDTVEDVAVILITGWLTPCRLGDALCFMSARHSECQGLAPREP